LGEGAASKSESVMTARIKPVAEPYPANVQAVFDRLPRSWMPPFLQHQRRSLDRARVSSSDEAILELVVMAGYYRTVGSLARGLLLPPEPKVSRPFPAA